MRSTVIFIDSDTDGDHDQLATHEHAHAQHTNVSRRRQDGELLSETEASPPSSPCFGMSCVLSLLTVSDGLGVCTLSPVALSWPTLRKAIAAGHLCFILPKHSRLPASPPLRCISAMLTAHASSSDAMCVAAMPVQKRCTQIAASLSTEATSAQGYLLWRTAMCTASAGRTASALTQVDGRSVHSEFLTASFGFFPGFAINFQVN